MNSSNDFVLATREKRALNFILDIIFSTILIVSLLQLLSYLPNPNIYEYFGIIAFFGFLFYYALCEAIYGKTLAKFISKTSVVDSNGRKPNFGKTVRRFLIRFTIIDIFSFLGNDRPRGWHDSMPGTYVIEDKKHK